MSTQEEDGAGAEVDNDRQGVAQTLQLGEVEWQGEGHDGEQQNAEASSEVAAVDGDQKDSDRQADPTTGVVVANVRQSPSDQWCHAEEDGPDAYQERKDGAKGARRKCQEQSAAGNRPQNARGDEAAYQRPVRAELVAIAADPTDVAGENADRRGDVGRDRCGPEGQQGRERDKGATAGDPVGDARRDPREDNDEFRPEG